MRESAARSAAGHVQYPDHLHGAVLRAGDGAYGYDQFFETRCGRSARICVTGSTFAYAKLDRRRDFSKCHVCDRFGVVGVPAWTTKDMDEHEPRWIIAKS